MKTLITATAAVLLTVPVLAAAPADAAGTDVRRSGSCSGSTDWKIKAGPDDGRIGVEAEIDSNRVGQTWRWRLRHDGDLADSGRSVTRAPSGSFSVDRRTGNSPGRDTFTFRATNRATGETCVARVSL
ncbi:hypothetical protein [Nocardioides sp.]|uniref:hypothetical protein n=1 Tax=Nocardioides sp. TaxID=35761 RepID=UPI0026154F29|nr:hypothetical protein [Nocardioides sp.]MDI6910001.1 hypothetical protein [Nocardioides sp.]